MASGADRLVRSLEADGVGHVFCIPGAKIDRVIDRLVDSPIQLVVCRHEQNAALIAQGIGRMTGKAGVCLVTSGPGCTNPATGLATADYESDPVVALGGAVPLADRLKPAHQAPDGVSLFRPITRFAAEVTAAHAIAEVVASAFRAAEGGRAGAAFVALPKDVMEGPAPDDHPGPSPRPRTGPPDPGAVAEAAGRIGAARNPVLLLGLRASRPDVAAAVRALPRRAPRRPSAPTRGPGSSRATCSAASRAGSGSPTTSPATTCSTRPTRWSPSASARSNTSRRCGTGGSGARSSTSTPCRRRSTSTTGPRPSWSATSPGPSPRPGRPSRRAGTPAGPSRPAPPPRRWRRSGGAGRASTGRRSTPSA